MLSENPVPLWKGAPFLRLVIPLMTGIGFQSTFPLATIRLPLILFAGSLVGFLLFSSRSIPFRFRFQWLSGVFLQLLVLAAGILWTWTATGPNRSSWYGHHLQDSSLLVLKIMEPPVEKPATIRLRARVEKLITDNRVTPASGELILYLPKDSAATALQYGQRLLTTNRAAPVKNSGNPGAFDYEKYCRHHNIFHQAMLRREDWKLLPGGNTRDFKGGLFHSRENLLRILEKYIPQKREAGMAEALTLGYRENLDRELIQAYSTVGAVHIIAISGLHLGLIYTLLLFALKPLPNHFRAVCGGKPVLLIAGLWLFALLTGAAPSVLRAALMFTAVIASRSFFQRPVSVYNTLSASAFLLLCYNPFFLFEVGFQLSYLAVLGIVIFQRPISRLLISRYWLLNKTGNFIAVSLSAQLLTFPLCLFYFHQFPLSFLAANLVAIPLAGVILSGSLLLLCLSPFPFLAALTGQVTGGVIMAMNTAILQIQALPFAAWKGIPVSGAAVVAIYFLITLLALRRLFRLRAALPTALLVVILLAAGHIISRYRALQQKKIIVYSAGAHTALDFIYGRLAFFSGDTLLQDDHSFSTYTLNPARTALGVRKAKLSLPGFQQEGRFIRFCQKRLILQDSALSALAPAVKFRADILILSKNPPVSIADLLEWYDFDEVVFDASNPLWKIGQWENECDRLNLRHFSVPAQGAYIANL